MGTFYDTVCNYSNQPSDITCEKNLEVMSCVDDRNDCLNTTWNRKGKNLNEDLTRK